MVITSKEFQPVLADVVKFIGEDKMPKVAREQFLVIQNSIADEIGLSYEGHAGLFEIFDFCEKNNIQNENVLQLFESLKNNNANIKKEYGLE